MESTEFQMIEERALAMDRVKRGQLASSLLRSLDEQRDSFSEKEIEELWMKEVERRMVEWDKDPSVGVPYEEVMSRLRARQG